MHQLLIDIPALFIVVVFLLALLIGSFLNVVIHRLPIMMEREWREQCSELMSNASPELPEGRFDLMYPRSRCPSCGAMISALQNIPVLSYLLLRGRCRACNAAISRRYPIIEMLTAVLSALAAWRFGWGYEALAAVGMTWALIAISVIDMDHQIIPDSLSLPLIWVGLAMSLFHPLAGASTLFIEPTTAIVGAIAGYLSLWSVYHLFRIVTGKEGMGYGDFKLLAALGAWLGWQLLPLIILLSAVVGATVGLSLIAFKNHGREVPIPFGPYLAAAGWIAMLYGPQIVDAYLSTLR